jgi:hypothetical protein
MQSNERRRRGAAGGSRSVRATSSVAQLAGRTPTVLPKFASGRTWRNLYGFLPTSRMAVFLIQWSPGQQRAESTSLRLICFLQTAPEQS